MGLLTRRVIVTELSDNRVKMASPNDGAGANLIYLTQNRLMRESERMVHEAASCGEPRVRSVCSQLLANQVRYFIWHSKHESRMEPIARLRRRELQLLELRRASVEFVHRAALVKYFSDYQVRGPARDRVLRGFFGPQDSRDAAILAHRSYLVAASSQLCATELLRLADDQAGIEQIQFYETVYAQYFGLFCNRLHAAPNGDRSLLDELVPEVRGVAERLRLQLLATNLRPVARSRGLAQRLRGVSASRSHAAPIR